MSLHRTARTIGKRVVPTDTTASGVWKLGEQELARRASLWPGSDPYWGSVKLLLSDSTQDKSTSVRTVTAAGDAQFTTTHSKFGGFSITGSNDTGGTTNYLAYTGADLGAGTSDFTVECWYMRTSSLSSNVRFKFPQNPTVNSSRLSFLLVSNTLYADVYGTVIAQSAALTWNLNQWYHCAISRGSGTFRLFRDGVVVAESTISVNLNSDTTFRIVPGNAGHYIDEYRYTLGVARYVSAFSPPSSPFPS